LTSRTSASRFSLPEEDRKPVPAVTRWSSPDANSSARAACAAAPKVFHLMSAWSWDEGTQQRPARLAARAALYARPRALPQSAGALAAPSGGVCCIDGLGRMRVRRKILSKIDSVRAQSAAQPVISRGSCSLSSILSDLVGTAQSWPHVTNRRGDALTRWSVTRPVIALEPLASSSRPQSA
jgi:hypothetical protein